MGRPLALVELVSLSHVGRVRQHNEDRALGHLPVFAVADGMGGAKAGEVAAQMAVDAVAELREPVAVDDVREAVVSANASIHRMAAEDEDKAGMGTTFTGALMSGSALSVVHVGDSRAYLWRDGGLSQITEDHSVVAELVRRGSLSPEEAETHPHRNVITRALGAERTVVPDVVTRPLEPGDVILLCSDGLSSYVPDREIAAVLEGASGLDDAAQGLVARANAVGGPDNITVVLARVGTGDGAQVPSMPTVEEPRPDGMSGSTAQMRVLGGVRGHAGTDRPGAPPPAPPPPVLEPVGRRRGRLGPILVGAVVLLALVVGGVVWVASRTYVVEPADDGTVRVAHGLPVSLAGVEFARRWQDTGVSADAVRAGRPDALKKTARGQGEAVALAVDLIWRYGLPEPPEIAAPAAEAPDTRDTPPETRDTPEEAAPTTTTTTTATVPRPTGTVGAG